MKVLLLAYLVLIHCIQVHKTHGQSCPSFGEDSTTAMRPYSTERKLYLNIKEPSQCNGTVTSWNFCAFNSKTSADVIESTTVGVKFMVYRKNPSSSHVYNVVPNSVYTYTANSFALPRQGCSSVSLSTEQQFQILENDLVAACVRDAGMISPLFVTSTGKVDAVKVTEAGYEMCRDDQLNSIDLSVLSNELRNALHLHATLDVTIPPRVGTNPPPSPSVPLEELQGTYLNTAAPAETAGAVRAWHYCFYTAVANNTDQLYTATVAVWRFNSTTNQYTMLEGSMTTLELQPETGLLAVIYCQQEQLDRTLYIRTGDVVGVVLSSNPIPMIGQNSAYSVRTTSSSQVMSVAASSLTTQQLALHLYADITSQAIDIPPETQYITISDSDYATFYCRAVGASTRWSIQNSLYNTENRTENGYIFGEITESLGSEIFVFDIYVNILATAENNETGVKCISIIDTFATSETALLIIQDSNPSTATTTVRSTTTNVETTAIETASVTASTETTIASGSTSSTASPVGLSTGALVGIIIGCLILLLVSIVIIVVIVILIQRSRRTRKSSPMAYGKGTIKKHSKSSSELLGYRYEARPTGVSTVKEIPPNEQIPEDYQIPANLQISTSTNMAYGQVSDEKETVEDTTYSEISVVRGRPMTMRVGNPEQQADRMEQPTDGGIQKIAGSSSGPKDSNIYY